MRREDEHINIWLTLLVDLISIVAAFFIAAIIRGHIIYPGMLSGPYGYLLTLLVISCIIFNNISNSSKSINKRGYFEELICILKYQCELAFILLGYMFIIKEGSYYSRIFLGVFFLLNTLLTYVLRSYMKLILLLAYKKSSSSSKVMLVTVSNQAQELIRSIRKAYEWRMQMTTIVLWDRDRTGERIDGLKVIANKDNIIEMVRQNVVDEVFIHVPNQYDIKIENIILELEKMGVIVHLNMNLFQSLNIHEKIINEFAGHQVLTFASGLFDSRQVLIKRLMDVVGALLGCLIMLIITLFLAPIIYIESPGPIFFSQTRIGKNGRRFKIYKFRSMYTDAEQRKEELMELNEMQGHMFKITDDPRITKVGKFIRKTSLDEFPQFVNVLIGDMSLVGTRPPTEDEFMQYEGRHKRRLMMKPGITGLWQVSGRSDIENFEDVVKMDLEYIDQWSIKLDIKLILKTVYVVLFGRGAK